MKKILILFAILLIPNLAHAGGEHKAGNNGANQSCFYDSKPGSGRWNYYFCGEQGKKCAGKKSGGKNWFEKKIMGKGTSDSALVLKNMEVFTFLTSPKDSYCCCGGTNTKAGRFVNATNNLNCRTDDAPREEVKNLGNGQVCKTLIYQTVCGDEERVECKEPEDFCETGYKWRGNECAPICTGDTVYENERSNKCVQCPTTNYQGRIDKDENGKPLTDPYCKKCDSSYQIFDKDMQKCVAKAAVPNYSKTDMKACFRCPSSLSMKLCLQALRDVQKKGLTNDIEIWNAMDRFAKDKESQMVSITNTCYLREQEIVVEHGGDQGGDNQGGSQGGGNQGGDNQGGGNNQGGSQGGDQGGNNQGGNQGGDNQGGGNNGNGGRPLPIGNTGKGGLTDLNGVQPDDEID